MHCGGMLALDIDLSPTHALAPAPYAGGASSPTTASASISTR